MHPLGIGVALAVFAFTYVLISFGRVRGLRIDRAAAALFGGVLMLLLLVGVAQEPGVAGAILAEVNLEVLLLLLGMLLLVAGLGVAGFFEWTAVQLVLHVKDARQLLVLTVLTAAVLSAVALNDAVVLLFTPTIIRTCRLLEIPPVPYVVAVALAANVGSVATPIGNPQNAFIAVHAGIAFPTFAATLLPVAAVALAITVGLLLLMLHRQMRPGGSLAGHFRPDHLRAKIHADAWDRPRNPRMFRLGLVVLTGTFAGFVVSSWAGIPLSLIALAGGAVLLFLGHAVAQAEASEVLRRVDWSILVFFIGLFLVIGGLRGTGTAEHIGRLLAGGAPGGLGSVAGIHGVAAVLSNLVSNVPAVLLLAVPVGAIGGNRLWLSLAASSTLAGNATILGAAANVIAVEVARKEGVEVRFLDFLKLGLPVTISTLAVSALLLAALP